MGRSRESDPDNLTLAERRFVDAYLGPAAGNGTEAVRLAGFKANAKTRRSYGCRLLSNPNIRAAIERRLAAESKSAIEVLRRITDHAFGNILDFVDVTPSGFSINLAKGRRRGKSYLIKSMAHTKEGVRIQLTDPVAALKLLATYHGLLRDGPVPTQEELDALSARDVQALAQGQEGGAGEPPPPGGEGAGG